MYNYEKKIIFIIPTLAGGGAERVISIISNYLIEKNYDVSIYLLREKNVSYELKSNIKVKTIIPKTKKSITKKIETIFSLRKLIKNNSNAIFISFLTNENIYLTLSTLGLKSKIIVSERNDPYMTINGKIKKNLINFLYGIKQCKYVVFQTTGAMQFYNEKVQKKGVIISNPIKENLPEMYTGIRRKEIITFARLEPQKNYPLLIKAFSRFSREHKDYRLGIYGKGIMEEPLKKLVKEEGLIDKVTFYGFCLDIHNKIKDAAMFVLSSDYEGVSNSMLEAMAIGLPCICTDCSPGGARMYIENNKNGILVPVKDVNKMYEAMNKIALDESFSKILSENAILIKKELNIQSIGMRWEKIINKIL